MGGPYLGIVVVVIVVVSAVAVCLYMMRTSGGMNAKCPKCGNVFDASLSLSGFHIGTLKQLKCPACGKISLIRTYVKDPITCSPKDKQKEQQTERKLTSEELEKKRIEESKYEKS